MKILVTGMDGQLGSEIKLLENNYTNYKFVFVDKIKLDITNEKLLNNFFSENIFDVVVNCAAYTDVDGAEDNFELADIVNNRAVRNLAIICKKYAIKLIHISTDYVFNGVSSSPYTESHVPTPETLYGRSKLDGENSIISINPLNSIIIRTSWLYSQFGNNFVKTMLELASSNSVLNVVNDQYGSPTSAKDLANAIMKIIPKIKNDEVEIYHYSNQGYCSWYNFCLLIFKLNKIKIEVNPIKSDKYITNANRPKYSILDSSKFQNKFDIDIPNWENSYLSCYKLITND